MPAPDGTSPCNLKPDRAAFVRVWAVVHRGGVQFDATFDKIVEQNRRRKAGPGAQGKGAGNAAHQNDHDDESDGGDSGSDGGDDEASGNTSSVTGASSSKPTPSAAGVGAGASQQVPHTRVHAHTLTVAVWVFALACFRHRFCRKFDGVRMTSAVTAPSLVVVNTSNTVPRVYVTRPLQSHHAEVVASDDGTGTDGDGVEGESGVDGDNEASEMEGSGSGSGSGSAVGLPSLPKGMLLGRGRRRGTYRAASHHGLVVGDTLLMLLLASAGLWCRWSCVAMRQTCRDRGPHGRSLLQRLRRRARSRRSWLLPADPTFLIVV